MNKVLVAMLLVTACGGGSSDGVPDGEELFEQTVLAQEAGCVTCHSREPGRVLVGPSLANIGVRAADRVEGLDAAGYIAQSIDDPDAYTVEGFPEGRMPNWGGVLSDAEIDALVDYLLTLREES